MSQGRTRPDLAETETSVTAENVLAGYSYASPLGCPFLFFKRPIIWIHNLERLAPGTLTIGFSPSIDSTQAIDFPPLNFHWPRPLGPLGTFNPTASITPVATEATWKLPANATWTNVGWSAATPKPGPAAAPATAPKPAAKVAAEEASGRAAALAESNAKAKAEAEPAAAAARASLAAAQSQRDVLASRLADAAASRETAERAAREAQAATAQKLAAAPATALKPAAAPATAPKPVAAAPAIALTPKA